MNVYVFAILILASAPESHFSSDVVIKTKYEAGHFYATPTLQNGKNLRLLLDTGGGSRPTNWVNEVQASSVGLTATAHCKWNNQNFDLAQPKYQGVGLRHINEIQFRLRTRQLVVTGNSHRSSLQQVRTVFHAIKKYTYCGHCSAVLLARSLARDRV